MPPILSELWQRFMEWIRASSRGPELGYALPPRMRVDVLPDRASYARGEQVTGAVLLRGGASTQTCRLLRLDAILFGVHQQEVKVSIALPEEVVVRPGDLTSVAFAFTMPEDMHATEDEFGAGKLSEGCRLEVSFMGGVEGRAVAGVAVVHVRMHTACRALLRAVEQCGFVPAAPANEDAFCQVTKRFRPEPQLAAWLCAAEVSICITSPNVTGRLTLTPAADWVICGIRSILQPSEPVVIQIEASEAALVNADGEANLAAAVDLIDRALTDSLLIGNRIGATLLRASSAPTDTLLQPASPTVGATENLLHPIGPTELPPSSGVVESDPKEVESHGGFKDFGRRG